MPIASTKPRFFRTAAAFHDWLSKHHETKQELVVAFYTKGSGKRSITYPEALDAALIHGWIDGIRRSLEEDAYTIRFTPRKARSIWSAVNVKRVGELIEAGLMKPAGLAAFAKRDERRFAIYSYERRPRELDAESLAAMQADEKAWADYQSRPPWYRRTTAHWILSAKKPETRRRRLATLIDCSRKGIPVPPLAYPSAKTGKRK